MRWTPNGLRLRARRSSSTGCRCVFEGLGGPALAAPLLLNAFALHNLHSRIKAVFPAMRLPEHVTFSKDKSTMQAWVDVAREENGVVNERAEKLAAAEAAHEAAKKRAKDAVRITN